MKKTVCFNMTSLATFCLNSKKSNAKMTLKKQRYLILFVLLFPKIYLPKLYCCSVKTLGYWVYNFWKNILRKAEWWGIFSTFYSITKVLRENKTTIIIHEAR